MDEDSDDEEMSAEEATTGRANGTVIVVPQMGGQLSNAKNQRLGTAARGSVQTSGALLEAASDGEEEEEDEEMPQSSARGPSLPAPRAANEQRAAPGIGAEKASAGKTAPEPEASTGAAKRKHGQAAEAKRQRAGSAAGGARQAGGVADADLAAAGPAGRDADAEPAPKRCRVSGKSESVAGAPISAEGQPAESAVDARGRPAQSNGKASQTKRLGVNAKGSKPASAGRPGAPELHFATTGLHLTESQKRAVRDLGAKVTDAWSPAVTHLIADTFRRTTKLMCAICAGAKIVTPGYVDACGRAGRRVDEKPFALRDGVCEAGFAKRRGIKGGYSLEAAVECARRNGPLLRGISVYCFPSVTDSRELPALVAAAGGTWLSELPASPPGGEAGLLLLAERAASGEAERQRRRAHEVYDVELLREAACTQELRREAYRLR